MTLVWAGVLYRVRVCCCGGNGADTNVGSRASSGAGILNVVLVVMNIMSLEGVGWSCAWGLG